MDNRSQTQELGVSLLIYIEYWCSVDSLQQDVESNLELDYEGASIPIGPSGPCSKLIYLVGMDYEGQIGSRFTFMQRE